MNWRLNGIKLPSQRAAEEKAREAQRNQYDSGDQYNDDEIDVMQQDELARQFAQTQQQRYGEQYQQLRARKRRRCRCCGRG